MSEGSNRIIVRVECIHDELFEATGYHPVGAEHVSVSFALYMYSIIVVQYCACMCS